MSHSLKYRAEIDGLRALAIIPVILFHLDIPRVSGGFVGVDVFLVISGYLITQIILRENESGGFTMRGFWARRVRRIMPALLAMLLVASAASLLISFPDTSRALGLQAVSVLSILANVAMWRLTGDYWGPQADSLALLHTWSLSLEEQFYVIHPFLILLLLRMRSGRNGLTLIAVCAGYLACIYGTSKWPAAAFLLLPTRAWELGLGCYFALLGKPASPSNALSTLGIILIASSVVFIDDTVAFPGFVAALPVLGTGLVLHFTHGLPADKFNAAALLGNRILVYIGRISYSLYLWHWPVIVLGREWQTRNETSDMSYLLLIPSLSIVSYHLIEQPARNSRRAVYVLVGCGFGASLALSLYLVFRTMPGPPSEYNPTCWAGNEYDVTPKSQILTGQMRLRMAGIERTERGEISADILRNGGYLKQYGSSTPSVVMFGSSHALMWARVVDDICRDIPATVSFQIANATPGYIPIPPGSEKALFMSSEEALGFDEGRMKSLERWKPRILIISDVYDKVALQKYRAFLRLPVLRDTTILFIEQPPLLDIGDVNAPRYVAWKDNGSSDEMRLVPARSTEDGRAGLRRLSEEARNVFVIQTQDLYMKDGRGIIRRGKDVLYIDDDHLSLAGAELARGRIREAILQHLR